tara:strand:+ start:10740 stop:11588 length:849 start_codon:yes stop_codon:yes gene_type:complete
MAGVFTAVAAIGGLALSAGSTAMSFGQMAKQKKLQREAERDAEAAMAEARQRLDVNYAEGRSIKKEAYDREREAMLVQGAMATEAGIESERGSAATAGRIYAGQQEGQSAIRDAMADEMTNIESDIIDEDSRLRDLNVALDLEEVAGNQQKAADAQRAAELSKEQGFQGALNTAQLGLNFVPLYQQNLSKQKAAVGGLDMNKYGLTNNITLSYEGQDMSNLTVPRGGGIMTGANKTFTHTMSEPTVDFNKMSNLEFMKWKRQNKSLYGDMIYDPAYTEAYNQ